MTIDQQILSSSDAFVVVQDPLVQSGCVLFHRHNARGQFHVLLYLYAEYDKMLLFVDNATYHKSAKLMKFLEEMGGKILLEYFLPYTPELNPVEQQWRIVKARMAGRVQEGTEEAKETIRRMLITGEIRTAKMYDYLIL